MTDKITQTTKNYIVTCTQCGNQHGSNAKHICENIIALLEAAYDARNGDMFDEAIAKLRERL